MKYRWKECIEGPGCGMPRPVSPVSYCLSLPANLDISIFRDKTDTEQVKYLYPFQYVVTGLKDLHGLRITRNRYETQELAQQGSIQDLLALGFNIERPE